MSFLARLRAAVQGFSRGLSAASYGGSETVDQPGHWLLRAISGGGPTKSGVAVNEFTAMHLPIVYAAVGIIADTVAQLPLQLMRKRASGDGSDHAEGEPLNQVLAQQPNELMSSFVWRQTGQHHALLWGNCYGEIEMNGRGEAVGIYPLLPDRTRPYKAKGGPLTYRTNIAGEQIELPAERVAHIPALGFDGILGYSPLNLMRQAVGMGIATEEFGAKFFANDAKSGGFLLHPGKLSAQAQSNLAGNGSKRERTDPGAALQAQGGLDNAHRVKVLEEGMKFVPTTIPPEDAQFLGTREFQVGEIARMYRVPAVLVGSHEKTTSWGSGIEQLIIGFVIWTIQPWIVRWEQELNRKLFTAAQRAAGYFVKFDIEAIARGDMTARAAFYQSGIQNRWLMPNEVRVREHLNRIDGLDDPPPAPAGGPAPVKTEGLRE